jgi:hypothetical protein
MTFEMSDFFQATSFISLSESTQLDNEYLEEFESYSRRGWDGEDAAPVTPVTLRRARSFLNDVRPPNPDAAPGTDGSIGLLWQIAGVYLYLDFKDNGHVQWYYQLPRSEARESVMTGRFTVHRLKLLVEPALAAVARTARLDVHDEIPAAAANTMFTGYAIRNESIEIPVLI